MSFELSNASNTGEFPLLNVASTCVSTCALGPGVRAVVWVQGCPLNCPGCLAPDWIPDRINRLVSPQKLVDELLTHSEVTGLTFSGGEPMQQAAGLALVARLARQSRELSVICFTGYLLEQLREAPPNSGVVELLAEVDVLIDSPYVASKNNNQGLRGSTNQRVHHLTGRLSDQNFDFETGLRQSEIHVLEGEALLVGVPTDNVATAFHAAMDKIQNSRKGEPK